MFGILLLGLSAQALNVLGLAVSPSSSQLSASGPRYSLPQLDRDPSLRAQEVSLNRAGYLYGPPLIGNSSYFPIGTLGRQRVAADVNAFKHNAVFITKAIDAESGAVVDKIAKVLQLITQSCRQLIVGRRVVSRVLQIMSCFIRMNGNNQIQLASLPATSPIILKTCSSQWSD